MKIDSHAKVNIFLKIVGTRNNYHELISRFVIVKNLFDTIEFKKKESNNKTFNLIGNFSCQTKSNTIYKAYKALLNYTKEKIIEEFFETHDVVVNKHIPEFAGLGGGSSNAASFLLLTNKVLSLGLDKETLSSIGSSIGADVSFFIYETNSANVSGIGEIVEEFKEESIDIETFTPKIACDTTKVYQQFRKEYLSQIEPKLAEELLPLSSRDILANYDSITLNDLFAPSLDLEPKLKEYQKDSWFFSGSGSSFFRIR
jgi:4-diphosphocytidyl-2-C-methyl-D-erythritol kinase